MMTEPSAPEVECTQEHASLRVSDVTAAVSFYTERLGFRLGFTWGDPPSMAGVTLMLLERGTPGPSAWSVYFVVGNADR
jgi:catechol 2,3-dioxygenase-like lactoylglutathione lyase family enzyme